MYSNITKLSEIRVLPLITAGCHPWPLKIAAHFYFVYWWYVLCFVMCWMSIYIMYVFRFTYVKQIRKKNNEKNKIPTIFKELYHHLNIPLNDKIYQTEQLLT